MWVLAEGTVVVAKRLSPTAERRPLGSRRPLLHDATPQSVLRFPRPAAFARDVTPLRNNRCTARKDARDVSPENIRCRFRC